MSLKKIRKDAVSIFYAGLEAVDPGKAVKRNLQRKRNTLAAAGRAYTLPHYENIFIIGAGKASAAMARAVEDILPDMLSDGVVNVKYGHSVPLKKVRINEAGHPVPDEAGLKGTQEIIRLLQKTGEKDLVLALISGGGSALLPYPAEGLTLEDEQQTTLRLLECGASIQEINAVRKHISRLKGGRLALMAYPSTLVSLILSDVIGDNLDIIASGPTVPDTSTFADCLSILEKYRIQDSIPPAVLVYLKRGAQGAAEETPKRGDPAFQKTQNIVIGSNIQAAEAARQKAEELGYNSMVLSTFIEGETREIARMHAALAKEVLKTGNPVLRPACLISGGETTVTLCGKGLGGRNQEFALASALEIDGLESVAILSGGTDGTDGPTDAAGAIADSSTLRRARALGLDAGRFLQENDSYPFFQALGDLLMTGPTLTNVMDLRLVLVA